MKSSKKPGKRLEKAARAVKDDDEFVAHIAHVADRYRREHALDGGPRLGALRQSLRKFHKHAGELAQWLRQAQRQSETEFDALGRIGAALQGSPATAHAEARNLLAWLAQAEKAAARSLDAIPTRAGKQDRSAPRIAAEGLRATFERHGIKVSAVANKKTQSPAVQLLCAIARSAGDAAFTPQDARRSLLESGQPTADAAAR